MTEQSELDKSRPVRKGEELELDRLKTWLSETLELSTKEKTALATMAVEQFGGGHSNLTYLLRFAEREIVLRRPPQGSAVKAAHDMQREWKVLSALAQHFAKVPAPIAFCDQNQVLGCDFYLAERASGLILRRALPAGLVVSQERARLLCEALVDTLIDLHQLDVAQIGLTTLGKPDGFVKRQVEGWSKRYQAALTTGQDAAGPVEAVADWLTSHLPTSGAPTLIHNDYKFDNVMFAANADAKLTHIFDWEMSTIGDPLMDLGTMLCYWVQADDPAPLQQARMGPTHLAGCLTRTEVAARYAVGSGRSLDDIVFYTAFGLFKTAGVCQQIFFRFEQGLTQDPRFAHLGQFAALLCARAQTVISRGEI